MSKIFTIMKLLTLTVFITVGLFAFTIISKYKFEETEMLGCGTVNMSSDVILPKYYDNPIQHAGLKVFQENCKTCHRLDQKLVGPALRNSFETRDSIWFVKMIVSANQLIDSGDTLAVRLFNDYNETRHPDFKGLSKKDLTDLVEFLKLEGKRDIVVD